MTSRIGPELSAARGSRSAALLLATVIAIVVVGVVGFVTLRTVRSATREDLESKLMGLLDANVAAVRVWAENQRDFLLRWAGDESLREQATELLGLARAEPDVAALSSAPVQAAIRATLRRPLASEDVVGFGIIRADGLIVSGQDDRIVGARLSESARGLIAPVFAGETLLCKAFLPGRLLTEPDSDREEFRMLQAAPILRAGSQEPLAALAFAIDPDRDFTRILSVGRLSGAGDTFAFDRDGWMISDSHYRDQLAELGLLPNTPLVRTALRVRVSDPGANLVLGQDALLPAAERPLTRMAAAATQGVSGIDVDGYVDLRGVQVVGAWRWLPELGFGIAVESDYGVAYGVLEPIRSAFVFLIGLLVVLTGVLLVSYSRLLSLSARVEGLTELGQYRLIEPIGQGGMGRVYLARHAMLRRPTAVKVISGPRIRDEDIARFEREVQLTSELSHPNTIAVYDYGRTRDGVFYYAMEFLRGLTLTRLVELEGPVPAARVVHILAQVAGSLSEAHELGFIHRDVKPANIMLCYHGGIYDFVKLLDFGLVKQFANPTLDDVTGTVTVSGTPGFIAPEQFSSAKRIDARTDIYAFGVVAYRLLTGENPFDASQGITATLTLDPSPPSALGILGIPPAIDRLVLECMAREPEQRPESARDVLRILRAVEAEVPWTQDDARRWWRAHSELYPATRADIDEGTTVVD